MNTAEIVIREVQRDSGFQIFQLFRESIGQSGKPSHLHSHGQILPFHVRRADMFLIRVPLFNLGYRLKYWAWGVFGRVVMLAVIAVQLYKLRKVHICPKRPIHGVNVEPETVCSDLHSFGETLRKIVNKICSGSSGTLADKERRNQFCFGINGHKNPLVAKLGRVIFPHSALLLKAERPYFIALDKVAFQVPHALIHEPSAAFSGQNEQLHNRVPVQSRHALCRANGAAFNQALNRLHCFGFINPHGSERVNRFGVGKGCRAGRTAVTLDSVPSITAKLFNGGVLAFGAGHKAFPLDLCGEKAENNFGSEVRLTPRFGLVPASASTEAGTFAYRVNRLWWGSVASHIPLPSFLERSALLSQGVSYLHLKSFLFSLQCKVWVNLTIKTRQSARFVLVNLESLRVNPLPYFFGTLMPFQDHVNSRESIQIGIHVMPKVYKPLLYIRRAEPFRVFSPENVQNLIGKGGFIKKVFGFETGSNRNCFVLAQFGQTFKILAHNHDALRQFFLLPKKVYQFLLGSIVSPSIFRGTCHA
jgi:hypothetical protein